MNGKVTITRQKYDSLKREAAAWRDVAGTVDDTVIFSAARDNGGKGVSVGTMIRILRKLEREDAKSRA